MARSKADSGDAVKVDAYQNTAHFSDASPKRRAEFVQQGQPSASSCRTVAGGAPSPLSRTDSLSDLTMVKSSDGVDQSQGRSLVQSPTMNLNMIFGASKESAEPAQQPDSEAVKSQTLSEVELCFNFWWHGVALSSSPLKIWKIRGDTKYFQIRLSHAHSVEMQASTELL